MIGCCRIRSLGCGSDREPVEGRYWPGRACPSVNRVGCSCGDCGRSRVVPLPPCRDAFQKRGKGVHHDPGIPQQGLHMMEVSRIERGVASPYSIPRSDNALICRPEGVHGLLRRVHGSMRRDMRTRQQDHHGEHPPPHHYGRCFQLPVTGRSAARASSSGVGLVPSSRRMLIGSSSWALLG